ncbi:amino acid/amide ABC transporter substrate-binding protein, HAAT family [Archaeoglobus sulfaticallidus PM70-1]|uniref:Amino acid/amide ABC transporter substrate-binding protein, HAAT family n=1 Tax=Archaeoglobus sulfaticallidus PM70-1 TaxID=387631 RepID=N0BDD1_9EURY|nr:ABC transporter substrate-binding protein [Archaeoglobus sulfaticallidus]AGK60262.1 amino acid/amide ABC transporter substrate-binding protein, HAAT family [Archaeoglobus sulfaticallidus PM70-1]
MKFRLLLLISLLIPVLVIGCTEEKAPTKTPTPVPANVLKIGVLIPKTGKFQTSGVVMENSARLAKKHIEEEMGIKVELVFADCGDSAEKTKSAFLELSDSVLAVVGAYSSTQAIAAADTAMETKTPYIVSVASAGIIEQKVNEGNRYVFRNAYNTTYWGELAVEFLKLSKAEGYYFQGFQPLSTFNQGMLNVIKKYKEPVAVSYYNPSVDPKDVQKKAVEAANAVGEHDVLILGDPGRLSISYLKEYRQNGGKGIVYSIGGVLALPQTLKNLESAEYTAFQSAALDKIKVTEYTEKYFEDYRKEFGEDANNYAGVLTYDAILILAKAFEKSGDDKEMLIKVLEEGEFTGACGVYKFNENHQALWGSEKLKGKISEWVDGRAVVLYPEEYRESDVVWP